LPAGPLMEHSWLLVNLTRAKIGKDQSEYKMGVYFISTQFHHGQGKNVA
jgi:hypothetical protein